MVNEDSNKDRAFIYMHCMGEVKNRIAEIDIQLKSWRENAEANALACENTALQLRKIYELVGFAAMTADLSLYREVSPKFNKAWSFSEILKTIERINPEFIPKPIRMSKSVDDGVDWHFEDRHDAVLSSKDLLFRHGSLNRLLHARNPFSKLIDYTEWSRKLDTWVREIASLLSHHRYVVGPHQEGYLVRLNNHETDVKVMLYQKAVG